jgi:hypothetical protein
MARATDSIWIESLRDQHGLGNACQISWANREWLADVEAVRTTAEDLFTCAAYADLIGELIRLGMGADHISGMLGSMLVGRDRRYFGDKSTLILTPGGSTAHKAGVVVVKRGSLVGELSPEEAQKMGRNWLATAEASEADTLFSEVLRRAGWMGGPELDALFGLLHDIRGGNADVPPDRDVAAGSANE